MSLSLIIGTAMLASTLTQSPYKTPDVYVEEVSIFPPSVAEVEVAIPAFIGHTDRRRADIATHSQAGGECGEGCEAGRYSSDPRLWPRISRDAEPITSAPAPDLRAPARRESHRSDPSPTPH